MRINKLWLATLIALVSWSVSAEVPDYIRKASKAKKVEYRGVCANSESQIDMEINNVRARLLGGGDCWWNFQEARYIVPKVDVSTGQREVSSIFSGSVWLGGYDPAGNLKLACQAYRSDGKNDFWPGPLSEIGITDEFTCKNWDRHFRVTGDEIRKHLGNLAVGNVNPDDIPRGVKGWPARGNPYFADVWGFDLPYTKQALAGFYDADGDNNYDPLKGDYPSIEIRGCPLNRFPDEMIFWIYNDQGGGAPHARTGGKTIQMEVQVQAFSYLTNDELNDMTFQRYKLINRATELIDSTYFAMWVDPDLGCATDDYVGCDSSKSLMYVYNQDATDGQPNCDCDGTATYCDQVPILGVDYFRGPLDENGDEIGMSSFVYYNNRGVGAPATETSDPDEPFQYYNYLSGSWRDGQPFTYGGIGRGGDTPTRYALSDPPNDPAGWSMCTANVPYGDRRTIQASGPFLLLPGAVNELIIGVPWVPDIDYPCPDLEQLFRADKLAQGLFDNCFELLDGPDAPHVDWIELNQQVIAVLTNDSISNNFKEQYSQTDFLAPDDYRNSPDSLKRDSVKYKFEGYRIYQLANPNVSTADFDDMTKSRPVYQVDIKNGIAKAYNWDEVRDPNSNDVLYVPEEKVSGANDGLRHTFSITEDKFAKGNDKRLINHKKYYFAVVAYSYNNFTTFQPLTRPVVGQQRQYLPGRKAADGPIKIFTVIPRPIVDQELNATYGEGVVITRYEGAGNNGNFLDLEPASRDALFSGNLSDTVLTYRPGRGPLTVTVFNPFEVKDGEYELQLVDDNNSDNQLTTNKTHWQLRQLPNGNIIASERTIALLNEQLLLNYGFSVTVAQAPLPGSYSWAGKKPDTYINPGEANGGIGEEVEYDDPNNPWLFGYADEQFTPTINVFNFVKTAGVERDNEYDPFQRLSKLGVGWFVPYVLCDWEHPPSPITMTPGWMSVDPNLNLSSIGDNSEPTVIGSRYYQLANLPSVDIVLTKDTSKWSRCVVIESASYYYTETNNEFPKNQLLKTESPAGKPRLMFDTRYALSVGKADANGDGLPDPDGAKETNGKPIYGMGWFPGYAINPETGQRLNIFFGENSCYTKTVDSTYTGRDMMWNPTDQFLAGSPNFYYNWVMGGQHFVYVTYTPYDGCESMRKNLTPELNPNAQLFKRFEIKKIAWAGMLQMNDGFKMNSLREGLIPNDVTIKLRVTSPFTTWYNDKDGKKKNGNPSYQFKIENREAQPLDAVQIVNALDSIKVVPNPYYGFSQYETSQFTNTIKITNLPGKCTVTIYSLDGKFIRQYHRDEVYEPYMQIAPDLEWDLKNNKGIPVASGVYLIQVQAPGMGERTIKWFGIGRQFDPSGL